jgi:hypothetical protein
VKATRLNWHFALQAIKTILRAHPELPFAYDKSLDFPAD